MDIARIEPPQGVVFMLAADKKFVDLMDSLELLQKTQDSSMEASYIEIKRITQKILAILLVVGIGALFLFFTRMAGQSQAIAEEKYRAIFEHATEGIFQMLPAGRVLSANLAVAHILAYDSATQLQHSVTDIERQVYAAPHGAASPGAA